MMPWDLQWTLVSWTTVSASSSPLYKRDFMSLLTLNSVFMLDVKLYFNFNCS